VEVVDLVGDHLELLGPTKLTDPHVRVIYVFPGNLRGHALRLVVRGGCEGYGNLLGRVLLIRRYAILEVEPDIRSGW
jgi:hypothetical protein